MSILAKTLAEAQDGRGEIRAGGTDLMERIRHRVSDGEVVDISRIPNLDGVNWENGGLVLGTLVKIHTVATHADVVKGYRGLAMAAGALATPQIRNAGTLGGSLLQRNRCWYYRHEDMSCFKKGGSNCPARTGNHLYGVCFDRGEPCVAPHPSTLGMVLMAYNAQVEVHGKGTRSMEALYGDGSYGGHDHLLKAGEILTAVHLPRVVQGEKAAYFRCISRARAEWPLVEVMARYAVQNGVIVNAHVGIGGVANVPRVLWDVGQYLEGKVPSEEVFRQAGSIAAKGVNPLPMTGYKVEMIRGTVYETLRRAEAGVWGGEG